MMDSVELGLLVDWLRDRGGLDVVQRLVPHDHPAALWCRQGPDQPAGELEASVEVLANGGHLPLLAAIVHFVRATADRPPPPAVDVALGHALAQLDRETVHRSAREAVPAATDIFVCYAHEDGERVDPILGVLRAAGLSLFRDVECIRPGMSIAASVARAARAARAAIVVVSDASTASPWVTRETRQLLLSRSANALQLYPVVIDDVPMPTPLQDLFAIDLRDLTASTDVETIERRLEPLLEDIRKGQTA